MPACCHVSCHDDLDLALETKEVPLLFWFSEAVFLFRSDCLGTLSVYKAGIELRDPSASAFQVLDLKVCATSA